jgi:hypothetical protein
MYVEVKKKMQTKIFLAIIATAVVAVALIGVTFALVSAQLQNSTQTPTQPYNYGYCPPAYNNGTGIYIPYPQTINPTPQTANQYGYGFGMGKGMCGRYW